MRGKFVLAPNGDQLVPSCLSIVQGLSTFQGVRSEWFNCILFSIGATQIVHRRWYLLF